MRQNDALTRRNRSSSASSAMPIGAPSKSSRKIASSGASSHLLAPVRDDATESGDWFMQNGEGEIPALVWSFPAFFLAGRVPKTGASSRLRFEARLLK